MITEAGFERWTGLGTTIVVGAADPDALGPAVAAVRAEVEACDRACSRFRADSELSLLSATARSGPASEWLCDAVATALEAARATGGLVDPTIGQCLVDLGYDRSFERLDPASPLTVTASHVPAWERVTASRSGRRVTVPAGVRLDLGATAKALCADRAAAAAARSAGTGVLVSLGGDIAVAGAAPAGGWVVRVTDRSDTPPDRTDRAGQTVAITTGGLATSGTSARRWSRAGAELHHLVDPRSGLPAGEVWRTVSVAAPTCVAANTASMAAVILGAEAPAWLHDGGYDARLVGTDGSVIRIGDWPAPDRERIPA